MCPGHSILAAPATAELEPLADGQVSQTDEVMVVAYHRVSPCLPAPTCLRWLSPHALSAPGNYAPLLGSRPGSPGLSVSPLLAFDLLTRPSRGVMGEWQGECLRVP